MYTVYICLYPKYPSFKGGRFSKASFFDIHIKLWGCTSHSDWKRLISYQLIWSSWCHMTISIPWFTHPKTNIAPQNGGLEDDFPFQLGDFEVPCQTSGVYVVFQNNHRNWWMSPLKVVGNIRFYGTWTCFVDIVYILNGCRMFPSINITRVCSQI